MLVSGGKAAACFSSSSGETSCPYCVRSRTNQQSITQRKASGKENTLMNSFFPVQFIIPVVERKHVVRHQWAGLY